MDFLIIEGYYFIVTQFNHGSQCLRDVFTLFILLYKTDFFSEFIISAYSLIVGTFTSILKDQHPLPAWSCATAAAINNSCHY
jgi:hypothetical protein